MPATTIPTRRSQLAAEYATRDDRERELADVVAEVRAALGWRDSTPVDQTTAALISANHAELAERLRLALQAIEEIPTIVRDLRSMPHKAIDDAMAAVRKQSHENEATWQRLETQRDQVWETKPGSDQGRKERQRLLAEVQAELDQCRERNNELQSELTRLGNLKLQADPQL